MVQSRNRFQLAMCRVLILAVVGVVLLPLASAQEKSAPDNKGGSWKSYRGGPLNHGTAKGSSDIESGKIKWRFLASSPVMTNPVVADGVVYFGDRNGTFYAIDVNGGKRIWEKNLQLTKDGFTYSSPVILKDRVITSTQAGILLAFARKGGSILWKRELGKEVYSSMKYGDGKVLFGCKDFKFHAIDPATGKDVWVHETGNIIGSTCAITRGGKVVFLGHDKIIYVLDIKTGKALKSYNLGYRSTGTPALAFGCIYMCTTGRRFTCFDLLSGQVRWISECLTSYQQGIGVWKDRVVVHIGKYLMCFNAQTGVPIWRTIIKGRGDVSPAVGTKYIYMSDASGHVYALNAETGEIVWEVYTAKGSASSPSLVDGVLYVGDGEGHLNAIQ